MCITHSQFVSVALITQHVNLIFMCRIILQSAACCAALPLAHYVINGTNFAGFLKENLYSEFLYKFCMKHFSF